LKVIIEGLKPDETGIVLTLSKTVHCRNTAGGTMQKLLAQPILPNTKLHDFWEYNCPFGRNNTEEVHYICGYNGIKKK
jgi:hypothetical protein